MEIQELLDRLNEFDGTYRRAEIDEAIARQEEMIPHLREILKGVLSDPQSLDPDDWGHIYAVYLLAYFRDTDSHDLIIDVFSLPDELPDILFGDTVTEDLSVILLQTSGGSLDRIKEFAENPLVYEYCRSAACRAIAYAVVEDIHSRETAIAYFSELLESCDPTTFPDGHSVAADCLCDLCPEEAMELINESYEKGLINRFYVGPRDLEKALKKGKEACLEELKRDLDRLKINDVHTSLEGWACFRADDDFPSSGGALFPGGMMGLVPPRKQQSDKAKKAKRKAAKAAKKKNRKRKKK